MRQTVTMIPGDGIGFDISKAVRRVIDASGAEIDWEIVEAGEAKIAEYGTPLPDYVLESIRKNKIALKGPITTPVGGGFRSVNVTLRTELDLYANVRPAKTLPNVVTRYENVDLVIVRENTEDLYVGIEHKVGDDAAESIKIITRKASDRIVRYAFEFAKRENRKKVTAVHKANILKIADGLFLECARKVAAEYPEIEYEEMIIDAMCMKLVQDPSQYDVLVLPNLYGDIVSDLCAGLVGGLGVAPGANIGLEIAVFEAVHGSAPQIANQNIANPLALLMSGVMMLRHIGQMEPADKIMKAVIEALADKDNITADLGGTAGTSEFADAIISKM